GEGMCRLKHPYPPSGFALGHPLPRCGRGIVTMLAWLHIAVPPAPLFFALLLVGLINGAFYAMLSLGLAVIFGLLNIINFTQGARNLGFMFLPNYRAWVILFSLAVCLSTWFVIERTRLGAYLRAATENPALVQAFGIDVPRMVTLTYGAGVALAALAGVLAAP